MVPVHASTTDPPGEGGGFPEQTAARPDAGIRGSPRVCRLDRLVVGPGVPLTDAQWARIEPLLPDRTPKRGGRRRDHREVIDAIAFKFQTGTQWLHVPRRKYGNSRGVRNRPRMWAVDGTWERVFTALVAQADANEDRRAGRPCRRPVPRRTDHEDPPCRRQPLSAAGFSSHRRTGRRLARLHGIDGTPARSPPPWTASHQIGHGPGRQDTPCSFRVKQLPRVELGRRC
ncbi:transposase [Streptomyces mirabilis]|uniref:transposase n=1 Tax=Streptomyces mirabilis TaxID=68239 RepID=UPI0036901838